MSEPIFTDEAAKHFLNRIVWMEVPKHFRSEVQNLIDKLTKEFPSHLFLGDCHVAYYDPTLTVLEDGSVSYTSDLNSGTSPKRVDEEYADWLENGGQIKHKGGLSKPLYYELLRRGEI